MAIWFGNPQLEDAVGMKKDTLLESLGIEIIEITEHSLIGTMPVDKRTVQPYGILHGGASVSLAETLGSVAAHLSIDSSKYYAVGMEVNANHLRPATSGNVIGTATPVHIGNNSHVWSISIKDEDDRLVCISRLTMAIISKDRIKR